MSGTRSKCRHSRTAIICRHISPSPAAAIGAGDDVQELDDIAAVRRVMHKYTEATCNADVATLRGLFHKSAIMNGYIGKAQLVGSPEPFFEEIAGFAAKAGSFKDRGLAYAAETVSISVYGNVATAVVQEKGYNDKLAFTDAFHLMKFDGEWKILSKLFTGSRQK
eukprot:TRINITY_DN67647_c0_g1_i1.p1 TRINITY_DN67647_c0_g1~~TRINITY_DN67647_c0_g1_i1.p1  ORF type:complete len:165 (-),score=36.89 TRINITY_DN67647_c0_g1_i1:140-634(-)